jgi:exopolysaccharide production protein ExoZ
VGGDGARRNLRRNDPLKTLYNLQILRAFAAMAVVFYHTDFRLGGVHTDFQGVAIFFVISGFIMSLIAAQEGGRFLLRRLIRIVPLYWAMTLLRVAIEAVHPAGSFALEPGSASWAGPIIKSLLFIPCLNVSGDMHPLLGVGWTLNLEMAFYLILAAALLVSRRWAPVITVAVLLAVKAAAALWPGGGDILRFYAHDYTSYFIAGIAAFYLWRWAERWIAKAPPAALAALGLVVAAAFVAFNLEPQTGGPLAVLAWVLPALLVTAALLMESAGLAGNWRLPLLLGNASYSLYLSHTFVVSGMKILGGKWPFLLPDASLPAMLLTLALAAAVSVALYLLLEKPATRGLRTLAKA